VRIIFEAGGANRIVGLTLRPELPEKLPLDPKAGYKQKARLTLPFASGDEWYVFWGGSTRSQNYHVDSPDQRHALDLVIRKDDSTHTGEGKENTDYYAWGRPIVAPAPGTVVAVVNDLPDNRPGVTTDSRNAAGNHVVLDLGGREYALLAHFQKGSVSVKVGDVVKRGDTLGLCGNSGNSTQPHLHFHLQDNPSLFGDAVGLPVTFFDYFASGKKVAAGSPVQGQSLKLP
jgi:murein DD-endopeptidase MepM/ murein hydrolase activator NlpD